MTVTLAYDGTLSRVTIDCNSLGAAVSAVVSRSVDQITWATVRGGGNVTVASGVLTQLSDYEFVNGVINYYKVDPNTGADQTANITPTITELWLKSVARPFLNMSFRVHEIVSPIRRMARQGIFDVVGRTKPVAVTDVRLSREYDLRLMTETKAQGNNLDLLLASGDILFLQQPLGFWPFDDANYVVPGTHQQEPLWTTEWNRWTLPIQEVAAAGPEVIGSVGTWQTVINTYATWADVIAAHSTWASLLTLIGDPDEVIVP